MGGRGEGSASPAAFQCALQPGPLVPAEAGGVSGPSIHQNSVDPNRPHILDLLVNTPTLRSSHTMSYPENGAIEAWLGQETPEEALEPDIPIVDPVRSPPCAGSPPHPTRRAAG